MPRSALLAATLAPAVALWLVSVPLRCPWPALAIAGAAGSAGGLFGAALALVTRTRRPGFIYLWLLVAAVALAPLTTAWPSFDPSVVNLWPGAPPILENYLEIVRYLVFLLAIPYPFAALGHHGPD